MEEDTSLERRTATLTPHGRPLWAPWRIQYIQNPQEGCFLCAMGAGTERPEHVIARGRHAFVLMNAFPYSSGHLLVAPYEHVPDLDDMEAEAMLEIMALITKAKQTLAKAIRPEGYNIGFNIGKVAGAGVADHLHGHIVPRWLGDTNFMPVLADTRCVPQALNVTADLLRSTWNELHGHDTQA